MKTNFPKLRFKEFTDEWQEKKLSDVAVINPSNGKLPESFYYIDLESVSNGKINRLSIVKSSNAPSRAQRILQEEDILYQTVRPYQKNNFFFDKKGDNFVASTGYAQIRFYGIPKFLYQLLHTNSFVNKVLVRCTGTSYPAINSGDLTLIKIKIPAKPEQQKIADFLTVVDEKIGKLEEKKKGFEKYKKGIMQAIFNQKLRLKKPDGSDYPDWEEKKLKDLGIFTSGAGFSKKEQGGRSGIPFYKVSDMNITGNETTMHFANNYVSPEQIKRLKYNVTDEKAIIFAKVGAAIFLERKRLAEGFLIDNNMMAFVPKCSIKFYKFIFDRIRLSKFAQVGALPSYNSSDIGIIKVLVPQSVEEQEKIAEFLTSLDNKVKLINKELEQVKLFKKSLLQQMFV